MARNTPRSAFPAAGLRRASPRPPAPSCVFIGPLSTLFGNSGSQGKGGRTQSDNKYILQQGKLHCPPHSVIADYTTSLCTVHRPWLPFSLHLSVCLPTFSVSIPFLTPLLLFVSVSLGTEDVAGTYNGILFSLEKERNCAIRDSVGEAWGHCAK